MHLLRLFSLISFMSFRMCRLESNLRKLCTQMSGSGSASASPVVRHRPSQKLPQYNDVVLCWRCCYFLFFFEGSPVKYATICLHVNNRRFRFPLQLPKLSFVSCVHSSCNMQMQLLGPQTDCWWGYFCKNCNATPTTTIMFQKAVIYFHVD